MAAATKQPPSLSRLLRKLGACDEAREWAKDYATAAEAWEACWQPDWMLWAIDKAGLWDDKQGRLFACWCVRETPLADGRKVWDLLTDERSRKAVEVAERFANGEATTEELAAARDAAGAAAWAARDAAWDAAWAAAWAAWDAAWAAGAAGAAAWDAAWAAGAAWAAAWAAQAKHLRKMFGNPWKSKKLLARLAGE